MNERHLSRIVVDLLLQRENASTGKQEILLLLRQNTGYYDGYYDLPGGHIEKGEDIFDAIIREAKEEVGIDIEREDLKLIHIYHHFKNSSIKFVFTTNEYKGKLLNNEPEQCAGLKWFEIENIPKNTIKTIYSEIENTKNNIFYSKD